MKDARQAIGKLAVAATALSALSATADIKYWDTPAYRAFDVECYVPGAVWNYDGIRNNGADQPHSTTTTTWKNLGSSGANNDAWVRYQKSGGGWSNTIAPASLDPVDGRNLGSWTENGFTFTGDSEWRSGGSIDTGTNYTIQVLVNATASGQTKAAPYLMSVQKDHFAFYIDKANPRLYWKTQDSTTSNHPFISGNDLGYATAILNGTDKTATFFSGTTTPTSGDGFRQFASVSGKSDAGYCICGYTGNDGQFVGTINFYRYYKRVLSDEELAWNRVVDEARFFKRVAPLPVTNVVVATSVAGAYGVEPDGCYAVDGRHTFVAPATVNVGGIDYVCTGYTVETRNGDVWSEPVFHKAALFSPCAFVVTEGECVRLTWQWAKAAGLANLGYTVHDYVWDGLEVFYDGICNVGTNLTHSYSATNWVNLGTKLHDNDLFIQRANTDGNGWETAMNLDVGNYDPGFWTENGFSIKGKSRFRCNSPGRFDVDKNYSLQMLMDAKSSDQLSDDVYPFGANNSTFAFYMRKSDGALLWRYGGLAAASLPFMAGGVYDYVTAIMKDANKQTFFDGTTEPTSGNGYKTNTSASYSDSGFCLGGYGKVDYKYFFVGTLKNFRQYNRALTVAELAQNRKVDDWRYFGIPDNPNVVVQSTIPYLRGDEPDGPYAVDGSHTFSAPASATAKGIEYACDGYTVETWDGSAWSGATSGDSNSYAYTTAAGLVRLTWRWRPVRGLRTAADYSFDDYSQAGLLWNYDGIRNQGGTDADHDSSATTWKNLGSGGSDYDLAFRSGETTTGEWADDGYIFRGGPRFRGGGKVGPLKNYTMQTLIDADIASQTASSSKYSYIMNAYDGYFNISLVSPSYDGSAASSFCWRLENNATFMYFHAKDNKYSYATALMDYDNKKAMMFPDTAIPTEYHKDGTYGPQRLYHEFASVTSKETTGYGLGNRNNNGTEGLVGTIKNFRYYDRVLTEEEIVRNRNVDAVRYFGALGVTNVYVVAGGGTQAETGAYKVEGEWTFHATTVDKDGVLKPVKGYYIQTLENGQLSRRVWHDGDTFKYSEDDPITGGKTVHLTWAFGQPGMCIIIR